MSRFFIDRPIFAWVVAILIMMAGFASLTSLPISQYPEVAPPTISITGRYPGASAKTLQDSVLQTIEKELNGLDGYIYMNSNGTTSGDFTILVYFKQGTDPNMAQVQVQNKLQNATPMLPQAVQRQGLTVTKHSSNFMLVVACYCDDGSVRAEDVNALAMGALKDAVARVDGVGTVDRWGADYSMRIWLKPDKLRQFDLVPSDVVAAIGEQNVQVAAGQLGANPSPKGVTYGATIIAKTQMTSKEEFEKILIRTDSEGSQILLRDVADVELGIEYYNFSTYLDGKYPAGSLGLHLASGANVLETTKRVKEVVERMSKTFPKGVKVAYLSENAPVVEQSIEAVAHTLIEAVVLVFCVMLLFLQRAKVTLVPTLTIPVVLLGTFGVLYAAGFTLNVVVMFALTLAIGLLVDDAIVVVENVERLMEEEGLNAKDATIKTMEQIQGALVGVGATISAVFLPTMFFGGSTGIIYRQFAITIVSAMLLSVFIALTFAPALCAQMLDVKPTKSGKRRRPLIFFRWFNSFFAWGTEKYVAGVERVVKRRKRYFAIFLLLTALVGWWYPKLPTGFLPTEDQGLLYCVATLPANASAHRTQRVLDRISNYLVENESDSIEHVLSINGYSFVGASQSAGMFFISMKPFAKRTKPGQDIFSIVRRAAPFFAKENEAVVQPIVPPSLPELGTSSGLDFYLQDLVGFGHERMTEIGAEFKKKAMESGYFSAVWENVLPDEPQYKIEIDDEKARAMDLNLSDVDDALSVAFGSSYVNDYLQNGRTQRVYAQGTPSSRATVADLEKWHVRNNNGGMVPFSAFASGYWTLGAPKLARYCGVAATEYNAVPADGVSSGQAMAKVEEIVASLPKGVGVEFTGLSYEEKQAGSQAGMLFALAFVIVFLCLAALYESWSVPFAIGLVVPFGILGAVAGVALRGLQNDVFFQVGLLTVMGLSAKNAILIVEFAKQMVERQGIPILKAVVAAARLRLRPILMTSAAFALGVVPMTKATGASSISQQSLGTCVLGGTIAATVLAIFFVPLFYVVVVAFFKGRKALQEK